MEEALEVEMKDLKLSRFFNVLILGLDASLANFTSLGVFLQTATGGQFN